MTFHIKGIDHIVLRTANLDVMLGFYRDLLGCPVERQLAPEVGLTQLRAGSSLIDLVTLDGQLGMAGGGEPSGSQRVDHFCLTVECDSEQALMSHLRQGGVSGKLEFVERYGATGFGRSLYIADPDGNRVELKLFDAEPLR